jgi:hypothetical protein
MGNDVATVDVTQKLGAKGLYIDIPAGEKKFHYVDGHAALVPLIEAFTKFGVSDDEVRLWLQHAAACLHCPRSHTRASEHPCVLTPTFSPCVRRQVGTQAALALIQQVKRNAKKLGDNVMPILGLDSLMQRNYKLRQALMHATRAVAADPSFSALRAGVSEVMYHAFVVLVQYAAKDPSIVVHFLPGDGENGIMAAACVEVPGTAAATAVDSDIWGFRKAAAMTARTRLRDFDPTKPQAIDVKVIAEHLVAVIPKMQTERKALLAKGVPRAPQVAGDGQPGAARLPRRDLARRRRLFQGPGEGTHRLRRAHARGVRRARGAAVVQRRAGLVRAQRHPAARRAADVSPHPDGHRGAAGAARG